MPRLRQSYCNITLGNANVGSVFNQETRAKGGYLESVRRVVDETRLRPGEKVLEVAADREALGPHQDSEVHEETSNSNRLMAKLYTKPGALRSCRMMLKSLSMGTV